MKNSLNSNCKRNYYCDLAAIKETEFLNQIEKCQSLYFESLIVKLKKT